LAKPPRVGARAAKNAEESEPQRRRGGWTPEATGVVGHVPSGGVARTPEASGRAGRAAGWEPGRACSGARAAGLESSGWGGG
jgi:hypothetical protein